MQPVVAAIALAAAASACPLHDLADALVGFGAAFGQAHDFQRFRDDAFYLHSWI